MILAAGCPHSVGFLTGTADEKSKSPLFPRARRQWLQMTSVY